MANKPNNPSLWSKAKSLARQKFDVYPSAYANGWASKYYKSKGGTWRKGQQGMQVGGDDEGPTSKRQLKRELFKQRVEGGDYDIKRSSVNDRQKLVMGQTKTAENILKQPRSVAGGGRSFKVQEAAKRTGWTEEQVRKNIPTAGRKYITEPISKAVKALAPKSFGGKFPGLMGPGPACKGGGCLDPKSTMKNGGMTPANKAAMKLAKNMKGKVIGSDRMLKHGGSHSRLKQSYLNRYK